MGRSGNWRSASGSSVDTILRRTIFQARAVGRPKNAGHRVAGQPDPGTDRTPANHRRRGRQGRPGFATTGRFRVQNASKGFKTPFVVTPAHAREEPPLKVPNRRQQLPCEYVGDSTDGLAMSEKPGPYIDQWRARTVSRGWKLGLVAIHSGRRWVPLPRKAGGAWTADPD